MQEPLKQIGRVKVVPDSQHNDAAPSLMLFTVNKQCIPCQINTKTIWIWTKPGTCVDPIEPMCFRPIHCMASELQHFIGQTVVTLSTMTWSMIILIRYQLYHVDA